jgi:hypothetical protein
MGFFKDGSSSTGSGADISTVRLVYLRFGFTLILESMICVKCFYRGDLPSKLYFLLMSKYKASSDWGIPPPAMDMTVDGKRAVLNGGCLHFDRGWDVSKGRC